MRRLAVHYENGAKKYKDRNWEMGQPMMRCFNSAVRHLYKWVAGHDDEDHLAAAAWNVFAMLHVEEAILLGSLSSEYNDRPVGYLKKAAVLPS